MKFTIVAGIFQIVLIVLFATLVDYGQHALPMKRKDANPNVTGPTDLNLPVNDVAIYYPSKLTFHLF